MYEALNGYTKRKQSHLLLGSILHHYDSSDDKSVHFKGVIISFHRTLS